MVSYHFPFLFLSFVVTTTFTNALLWNKGRINEVPPLTIERTNHDYNGTIIIIGAGAAGIAAAYTLEYLGVTNYYVFEAKDTIGGRVQEMKDFIDLPLDLGAEWIHTHPRILQDMILFDDTVTDETIVYRPKQYRWAIWHDRLAIPLLFRKYFYREWKFKQTTWKSYLHDYMYTYIQDHVQVGMAVQKVDYTDDTTIQVIMASGDIFEADQVIVAVPPTMLKNGNITFTPALPSSKTKQIDKVRLYKGFKIWFEFEERFYKDNTIMDPYRNYFDGLLGKPSKRNVLTMLSAGGRVTDQLVELNDEDLFQYHMKELDNLFHGQASRYYIQHRIQNWSKEPYIEGTWATGYNSPFKEDKILQPVDKRIYFCGAYLSRDHYATVHGGILSGREVAQKVLIDAA